MVSGGADRRVRCFFIFSAQGVKCGRELDLPDRSERGRSDGQRMERSHACQPALSSVRVIEVKAIIPDSTIETLHYSREQADMLLMCLASSKSVPSPFLQLVSFSLLERRINECQFHQ